MHSVMTCHSTRHPLLAMCRTRHATPCCPAPALPHLVTPPPLPLPAAADLLARLLPGIPHKGPAPASLHSPQLSQLCSAAPQPPQPAPPAAAQRLLRHAILAQWRQPAASADVPRTVEQLPAGSHRSAWQAQLCVGAAACHAPAGVRTS